jgi:hypothetical protein
VQFNETSRPALSWAASSMGVRRLLPGLSSTRQETFSLTYNHTGLADNGCGSAHNPVGLVDVSLHHRSFIVRFVYSRQKLFINFQYTSRYYLASCMFRGGCW